MSDVSELPFAYHLVPWRKHRNEVKLQDYLLELWRTNKAFQRMMEMDKIMVVNRGESFYCTRFMDSEGETEYEGHMGKLKGYAMPGSYVKFTQHHIVCYPTWSGLYHGLCKGGYHPTHEQLRALRETGLAYLTNALDNRLHWVVPVDRKLRDLLRLNGYMVDDVLHGEKKPVQIGDYLCVDDRDNVVEDRGGARRSLRLEVCRVRSKAYGNERFLSLHHALV